MSMNVARHIGGLENWPVAAQAGEWVARHIGGLEKWIKARQPMPLVARHIGGLENPLPPPT